MVIDAHELVVDNFAGGGGASTGIEAALGRAIDIAINHDAEAIAMHRANHPRTRHYCESVWTVDPREACGGRPVGLAWFSPDCTHFSKAKGAKPKSRKIRALAWLAVRWARAVRPRVMVIENVEEFTTWGPLDANGQPDPRRAGRTFKMWMTRLRNLGYAIEHRELIAADYGAPTTRKRLFVIARCDGVPIQWPEPTHGKGRMNPWRAAAEIIDWSIPCPSIFGRKRPLVPATMRRIGAGVRRFVIEPSQPFLVPGDHSRDARVTAWIAKHYGGMVGQSPTRPLGAVTARDHHALVTAFVTKFYGTSIGSDVRAPLPTVTAAGQHLAEVRAWLVKFYGSKGKDARSHVESQQQSLFDPLHTITSKARFGLVMVHGEPYQIVDIGMRMLAPRELFAAQGFPAGYEIAPVLDGRSLTKTAQTARAGNSVPPPMAEAIVNANFNRPMMAVA